MPDAAPRPPDPLAREFGRRVREARLERGLSLAHLAGVTGMSQRMLEFVEHGQKAPGLRNVVAIAEALGVEPGRLLDGLRTR